MRILMLGWEFPPYISGGLGTACYGLACAMEQLELDVVMVLPTNADNLEAASVERGGETVLQSHLTHIVIKTIPYKVPNPYSRPQSHSLSVFGTGQAGGYDGNLIDRVNEYATRCLDLIKINDFDVICGHDWVTFPAAEALSKAMGKPFVVHVHATEVDRSGEHINPAIYNIERRGMEKASAVITVSYYTASLLMNRYAVPFDKIHIVHNGINPKPTDARHFDGSREQRVLFLGRMTSQKGPEYFVQAAEQVLSRNSNVKFIMAGWGDLAPNIVEMVASKGLGDKIFFTGFLRGKQLEQAYRMSDLYVMPSVSEPFGLTALEAVQKGLPVILSKTTGVGEILSRGALKVDFWDVNKMAGQITDVLDNPVLAEQLRNNATNEIRNLTWDVAAKKCLSVYNDVTRQFELTGQNN